jgi:assimilatory nitrate reductase catalytic subunit
VRPGGEAAGERRFFADGGFFTPDRKARFVPPEVPALQETTTAAFPFRLNTGRVRDQWHTMTRSGLSPRLGAHLAEPFVEVHPRDAQTLGLTDGGFAEVSTAHGACTVKVLVSDHQQPGLLFMPIHWSDETASSARVGDLVSARTDPYSGQPEAKATPAAIAPVSFDYAGIARARTPLVLPPGTWWARVAVADGLEYRLATNHGPMLWHDFAYRWLGPEGRLAERLDGQVYRAAAFEDGELDGWLGIAPASATPRWDLEGLSDADARDAGGRHIPKRPISHYIGSTEPIVCACHQVGLDAVRRIINRGEAKRLEDIGRALRAGTNCGSCLPELKRILVHERIAHPD